MDLLDVGQVFIGLVLLVAGGESLVRGAAALAAKLGMSPLVVGLTVVAFATSAPELAVTLGSVLNGEPDLAVGNVVGSNIANVLFILGISALMLPLLVKVQLVRVDIPFMVALSVLFFVLALDGSITTIDGLVLFVILVLYISVALVLSRREPSIQAAQPGDSVALASAGRVELEIPTGEPAVNSTGDSSSRRPETVARLDGDIAELSEVAGPWWRDLLLIGFGVGLLVVGANTLVNGATGIASAFGVSELIIGLTVVAIGTSLPELATSVVAVRQGQRDLAVGNVVGSNIFNIGAVMGLAAIVSPGSIPVPESALALDIPLMIAASVVLLPIAFTGSRISRWEGGLFLSLYIAYILYLILAAGEHQILQGFTTVMLWFVAPLVALALISTAAYEAGRRRQAGHHLLDPLEEDLNPD